MSLLATATYLSIPSVAHLAISTIIANISPYTLLTYLTFAIGATIENVELLDEPAVGLASVAQLVSSSASTYSSRSITEYTDASSSSFLLEANVSDNEKHTPPQSDSKHYYGVLSDRVGHGCACWLARWGIDILAWEEGVDAEKAPKIWRRGGLTPQWVRAILSSNFFFVKSEWDRYDAAKRVVELRRKGGILYEEESVWDALFENGIIYAHMSFEQLREISHEVSEITRQFFVKPSTIHAANWIATEFRSNITARPPVSVSPTLRPNSPTSPISRDKNLGISRGVSFIRAEVAYSPPNGLQAPQFRIPGDVVEPFFVEPDTSSTPVSPVDESIFSHVRPSQNTNLTLPKHQCTQHDYFGIYEEPLTASSILSREANNESAKWTTFPPLRFGIEFWDLDALRERTRLHSHTVWYGGSLFNVYALAVRKKGVHGVQLGIYLHRQSSVEPIPHMSTAGGPLVKSLFSQYYILPGQQRECSGATSNTGKTAEAFTQQSTSVIPSVDTRVKLSINADGTGSFSRGSTPSSSRPVSGDMAGPPYLVHPPPPHQPYRDPRPLISAYFTISCSSPSGASVTRFSSGPDVFGIGQSWGWKTSSFRSEEYLIPAEGADRPKKSLRATVMIGLL